MFVIILTALGGVSLFIFGLKLISQISVIVENERSKRIIQRVAGRKTGAFLTGIFFAGLSQSSAIVSVLSVEFVEKGIISLGSSFSIIMGANVGTTVTAQLVSLSGFSGEIICAITSIIGLLTGFCKNSKLKIFGNSMFGLAVLFSGLSILSKSITAMSGYLAVQKIFAITNPFVLFLNGLVLTSLVQSSSAVTGVMVTFASVGLISFESSVFLTLGSNVGSCVIVVLLSLNKSAKARRSAYFNLLFNFLGSLIFFPVFCFFGDKLSLLFLNGTTVGRAIANFHTVFNLLCSFIFLPFVGAFEKVLSVETSAVMRKKFL
ncbi:MAG: Na/Pi cotransporter family protein [Clostridia bacterium]|nr:Na/Pi cotransporter family protein [Clostridia bacterium]